MLLPLHNFDLPQVNFHTFGIGCIAQCALRVVRFPSNQTSWDMSWNLRLYKLFNIYLSLLVRLERKRDSWGNCEFQTLNPWFSLKYAPVSSPSSLNMPLYPPLLLIVSDTGPFWLQGHRTTQSAHCAMMGRHTITMCDDEIVRDAECNTQNILNGNFNTQ